MQLFIKALLVITYVAGTFCQKITFDNTDVGGITLGRMYIDGTIEGNVTELLHQNWKPIIFIEAMKINATAFSALCQYDVSGSRCDPDPVDICQCVYNTIRDNVHIVVNGTASPDQYKAIIRAKWQHINFTTVYSNKNYTVPGPEDVTSTTVESTSDGNTTNADVTTTTTESSSSSPNITATEATTTSAEPPSSSSKTTVPPTPSSGPNIPLIVCLCVILPLVAITVVIGIFCYCKKKKERSQAVSNNGTGSTPKEDKHEHPKQQSEHTNQAYEDERRSSPSNVTMHEVKATTNNNLLQHNSHQKDVNNSYVTDNTNDGSVSQNVPGERRRLPPIKGTNIHGQLQPTGQPRPASVEITSQTVKHK